MNKPWKVILILVGIFIAGGVTGGFVMVRFGRQLIARRPGPDQWATNHLKRLEERLELTPAQEAAIRPIIRRNMDELNRLRTETMTETKRTFARMEQEISTQLTPEQRTKFEQMNREMRERAKRFFPERKNRPPGPGGSHAPRAGEPGKPDGAPPPPPDKPPGS